MQSPTTNIVDQAIEGIEAQESGLIPDDANKKGADDAKDTSKETDTKDTDKDKSGAGDDDTDKSGDKAPAKPQYDKDGKEIKPEDKEVDTDKDKEKEEPEEGKFTADDAIETELPVDDKPDAPTDNAGIQLSPAEQAHIRDNIGEPIVIRGLRGDKEVEIKAYSPNDIPVDFKFANDQQMVAAQTSFMQLEQKANQLLGNFRQNQSTQAANDFQQRENEGIRADVADLQKEGLFPKFTVQPGAAGFDDSPEAKQMAAVLDLMTSKNEMYFKQYQQGRPYKHIGFAEAFTEWNSKKPAKVDAPEDTAQKKEDEERKKTGSERSESNRGMSSSNIVKPTVRPGTTTRDILNRIDNEEF